MRMSSPLLPATETLLEQMLHHLEQCREVAPLIGDADLSEHLQVTFDLCLERFCDLKRATLESQMAAARHH